jgi:hypothetical protein
MLEDPQGVGDLDPAVVIGIQSGQFEVTFPLNA